jgi:hypothetical protein
LGGSEVATNGFGTVVIAVTVMGAVIGILVIVRYGLFEQRWRGDEWMFHGDADTLPHDANGMSHEERHAIDPEPVGAVEPRQSLIAPGSRTRLRGG